MTIVSQFHILGKVKTLDGRDVSDVKEPDIGQDLALKHETRHDTAENVDIDLEVRSGIDQSQLGLVRETCQMCKSVYWVGSRQDRTPVPQHMPAKHRTISVRRSTTRRRTLT